jgi:hypothetical protein
MTGSLGFARASFLGAVMINRLITGVEITFLVWDIFVILAWKGNKTTGLATAGRIVTYWDLTV